MIIGQQNNRFLQRVNPEIARAKADGGSSNNHPEIHRLMRQMVDMGIADDLKLWVHSGLVKERVVGADVFAEKAYDISGERNDGVQSTSAEQPLITTGFDFDGSSDWLDCGNDNSIKNPVNNVSYSFWFNSSASVNQTAFSLWYANSNDRAILCRLQSNGTFRFWISSNGSLSTNYGIWETTSSYNDGNWHLITFSYNSAMTIFVDGASAGFTTVSSHTGNIYNGNASFSIGTQSQNSASRLNFWNGSIDDFRILSTLSLAQHTSIYNATQSNY